MSRRVFLRKLETGKAGDSGDIFLLPAVFLKQSSVERRNA